MTNLIRVAAVLAVSVVLAVSGSACDSGDTAISGPDASPLPDVTDDFDDTTVYLYGNIFAFVPGSFGGERLANVQVCLDSHPEISCVTTDAGGSYRIDGVANNTQIVIVATLAGYVSAATQTRTVPANGQQISLALGQDIGIAAIVRPLGYDFPFDGVGAVSFRFRDFASGGLRGAVITTDKGDVVYTERGGVPNTDLTESRRGDGFVFNVPVGELSLDIDAPGFRCNLGDMAAFPGDNENQVRAIVVAGAITTVTATCAAEL